MLNFLVRCTGYQVETEKEKIKGQHTMDRSKNLEYSLKI